MRRTHRRSLLLYVLFLLPASVFAAALPCTSSPQSITSAGTYTVSDCAALGSIFLGTALNAPSSLTLTNVTLLGQIQLTVPLVDFNLTLVSVDARSATAISLNLGGAGSAFTRLRVVVLSSNFTVVTSSVAETFQINNAVLRQSSILVADSVLSLTSTISNAFVVRSYGSAYTESTTIAFHNTTMETITQMLSNVNSVLNMELATLNSSTSISLTKCLVKTIAAHTARVFFFLNSNFDEAAISINESRLITVSQTLAATFYFFATPDAYPTVVFRRSVLMVSNSLNNISCASGNLALQIHWENFPLVNSTIRMEGSVLSTIAIAGYVMRLKNSPVNESSLISFRHNPFMNASLLIVAFSVCRVSQSTLVEWVNCSISCAGGTSALLFDTTPFTNQSQIVLESTHIELSNFVLASGSINAVAFSKSPFTNGSSLIVRNGFIHITSRLLTVSCIGFQISDIGTGSSLVISNSTLFAESEATTLGVFLYLASLANQSTLSIVNGSRIVTRANAAFSAIGILIRAFSISDNSNFFLSDSSVEVIGPHLAAALQWDVGSAVSAATTLHFSNLSLTITSHNSVALGLVWVDIPLTEVHIVIDRGSHLVLVSGAQEAGTVFRSELLLRCSLSIQGGTHINITSASAAIASFSSTSSSPALVASNVSIDDSLLTISSPSASSTSNGTSSLLLPAAAGMTEGTIFSITRTRGNFHSSVCLSCATTPGRGVTGSTLILRDNDFWFAIGGAVFSFANTSLNTSIITTDNCTFTSLSNFTLLEFSSSSLCVDSSIVMTNLHVVNATTTTPTTTTSMVISFHFIAFYAGGRFHNSSIWIGNTDITMLNADYSKLIYFADVPTPIANSTIVLSNIQFRGASRIECSTLHMKRTRLNGGSRISITNGSRITCTSSSDEGSVKHILLSDGVIVEGQNTRISLEGNSLLEGYGRDRAIGVEMAGPNTAIRDGAFLVLDGLSTIHMEILHNASRRAMTLSAGILLKGGVNVSSAIINIDSSIIRVSNTMHSAYGVALEGASTFLANQAIIRINDSYVRVLATAAAEIVSLHNGSALVSGSKVEVIGGMVHALGGSSSALLAVVSDAFLANGSSVVFSSVQAQSTASLLGEGIAHVLKTQMPFRHASLVDSTPLPPSQILFHSVQVTMGAFFRIQIFNETSHNESSAASSSLVNNGNCASFVSFLESSVTVSIYSSTPSVHQPALELFAQGVNPSVAPDNSTHCNAPRYAIRNSTFTMSPGLEGMLGLRAVFDESNDSAFDRQCTSPLGNLLPQLPQLNISNVSFVGSLVPFTSRPSTSREHICPLRFFQCDIQLVPTVPTQWWDLICAGLVAETPTRTKSRLDVALPTRSRTTTLKKPIMSRTLTHGWTASKPVSSRSRTMSASSSLRRPLTTGTLSKTVLLVPRSVTTPVPQTTTMPTTSTMVPTSTVVPTTAEATSITPPASSSLFTLQPVVAPPPSSTILDVSPAPIAALLLTTPTPNSSSQDATGGGSDDDLQELPLPPTAVEASSGIAVATTTLGAGLGSPAAMLQVARIVAVLELAKCAQNHRTQPLPFPQSFIPPLRFGPELGQFYRGALLANVLFLVLVAVPLLFLGGVVISMSKKKSKEEQLRTSSSLGRFATEGRMPGSIFVAGTLVLDGTVSCVAALFAHTESVALDASICCVVVIAMLLGVLYGYWRIAAEASCNGQRSDTVYFCPTLLFRDKDGTQTLGDDTGIKVRLLRFFLFGWATWFPVENGTQEQNHAAAAWYMGFRLLFSRYFGGPTQQQEKATSLLAKGRSFLSSRFLFLELFLTIGVSIAKGVRPSTLSGCLIAVEVVLALQALALVLVLVVRPYTVPVKNVFLSVIVFLSTLATLLVVIAMKKNESPHNNTQVLLQWSGWIALLAAYVSTISCGLSMARFVVQRFVTVKPQPGWCPARRRARKQRSAESKLPPSPPRQEGFGNIVNFAHTVDEATIVAMTAEDELREPMLKKKVKPHEEAQRDEELFPEDDEEDLADPSLVLPTTSSNLIASSFFNDKVSRTILRDKHGQRLYDELEQLLRGPTTTFAATNGHTAPPHNKAPDVDLDELL